MKNEDRESHSENITQRQKSHAKDLSNLLLIEISHIPKTRGQSRDSSNNYFLPPGIRSTPT